MISWFEAQFILKRLQIDFKCVSSALLAWRKLELISRHFSCQGWLENLLFYQRARKWCILVSKELINTPSRADLVALASLNL